MSTPDLSLRSRTRALVREQVRSSALELFLSQGYDDTPVSQVAEVAGISQSSFFRYFRTKEDVVIDAPPDLAEELREHLCGRPNDESVWDSLRETMRLRTALWESDPATARQVLTLLASSEQLRARQRQRVIEWQNALVPETMRRLRRRDKYAELRAHAVVSTVFACLDAAFQEWARSQSAPPLDDLLDVALAAVRS